MWWAAGRGTGQQLAGPPAPCAPPSPADAEEGGADSARAVPMVVHRQYYHRLWTRSHRPHRDAQSSRRPSSPWQPRGRLGGRHGLGQPAPPWQQPACTGPPGEWAAVQGRRQNHGPGGQAVHQAQCGGLMHHGAPLQRVHVDARGRYRRSQELQRRQLHRDAGGTVVFIHGRACPQHKAGPPSLRTT